MKSHHQAQRPLDALPSRGMKLCDYVQSSNIPERERGIYIHVPFCTRTCTFCNLQRSNRAVPEDYADLVTRQIEQLVRLRNITGKEYSCVYFGGGTPTALDSAQLTKIIGCIKSSFPLTPDAEISIESSLTDLDDEKLDALLEAGVNRLSIGVQTFSDRGRKLLGRRKRGDYAQERLEQILRRGMDNTNIDLIYSYPGQSAAELEADVRAIVETDIAGLSYYSLIVSPGSVLGARRQSALEAGKETDDATDERDYENWEYIYNTLFAAGFNTLEITKLVRPGRDRYRYIQVRHANGDILPLGAGAGGRVGDLLLHMPSDLERYAAILEQPVEEQYQGRLIGDEYNQVNLIIGTIQLGYIDVGGSAVIKQFCESLYEQGLGELQGDRFVLNAKGMYMGNNIGYDCAQTLIEASA